MPDLSGYILALLQERVGSDQAIPAETLAAKATDFYNVSVTGREIRQAVHDLRMAGQPICSGSGGFFWPVCLQDVLATADHEFRGEARSMLKTARLLRQSGRALFGGQMGLM